MSNQVEDTFKFLLPFQNVRTLTLSLKLNNRIFTLTVGPPSDDHIFLHFLSHFGGKKNIKKATLGFELVTTRFKADRDNHYTIKIDAEKDKFSNNQAEVNILPENP